MDEKTENVVEKPPVVEVKKPGIELDVDWVQLPIKGNRNCPKCGTEMIVIASKRSPTFAHCLTCRGYWMDRKYVEVKKPEEAKP